MGEATGVWGNGRWSLVGVGRGGLKEFGGMVRGVWGIHGSQGKRREDQSSLTEKKEGTVEN